LHPSMSTAVFFISVLICSHCISRSMFTSFSTSSSSVQVLFNCFPYSSLMLSFYSCSRLIFFHSFLFTYFLRYVLKMWY
jgi:hypothetical protein